jgi:hypothetical protein
MIDLHMVRAFRRTATRLLMRRLAAFSACSRMPAPGQNGVQHKTEEHAQLWMNHDFAQIATIAHDPQFFE